MPSPLAHAAAGYLIGRAFSTPRDGARAGMVWAAVALSLLPDFDAAVGMLLSDMGRYHNHMMSSPLFALFAALGIGAIGWRRRRAFLPWFGLALACYLAHIAMDLFTHGRGIMLLWPFTEERFRPPFTIFYGVHWSDGLFSSRHVWTLLTELGTLAVLGLALAGYGYLRGRRAAKLPAGSADNG